MRIIILIECLLFTSLLLSQKVKDVTHVAYTVSDTEQAVDFLKQNVNATVNSTKHIEGIELQRLFGLRDEGLSLKVTSMQIGSDELRLLEFDSKLPAQPIPQDSKSNDLWFQHIAIVVDDMDLAYEQVHANNVEHVSTALRPCLITYQQLQVYQLFTLGISMLITWSSFIFRAIREIQNGRSQQRIDS